MTRGVFRPLDEGTVALIEAREARFWPKVDVRGDDECWVWLAHRHPKGYGCFSIDGGRHLQAHRIAYQLRVGAVSEGHELDHLCRNRACVNPRHLEPVPHRVNVLRGEALSAQNARKTVCLRGHSLADAYVSRGARKCRTCYLDWKAAHIEEVRRRDAANARRYRAKRKREAIAS